MSKKFFITALVTAVVLFILNGIAYAAFLKNFFQTHPAVSKAFMQQLYRPDDQLLWWAIIISAIAIGFLVTMVIKWSGARSFSAGLRAGLFFGLLLLCSVDFGLLGSTNNFTTAGAIADLVCSTITVTLSSGFCAWMLGRGTNQVQKFKALRSVAVEVD
jgi:hypothetical protein